MTSSPTQQQARALGDPTRHRIFGYLAESAQPVGVGELTDHLGLNHNTIRQHLSKLVSAGLVVQETAPAQGRGRPRLIFRVHPDADQNDAGTAYQRLSLLLVDMLKTGDSAVEVGRRAAVVELPVNRDERDHPIQALASAMRLGGFDPVLATEDGPAEFILRHCPFADAAAADMQTICGLHLGLAQGLADQLEGVVVDELEPHDPRQAGCRLRFHLVDEEMGLVDK